MMYPKQTVYEDAMHPASGGVSLLGFCLISGVGWPVVGVS